MIKIWNNVAAVVGLDWCMVTAADEIVGSRWSRFIPVVFQTGITFLFPVHLLSAVNFMTSSGCEFDSRMVAQRLADVFLS